MPVPSAVDDHAQPMETASAVPLSITTVSTAILHRTDQQRDQPEQQRDQPEQQQQSGGLPC
jgi:hypothetical protein